MNAIRQTQQLNKRELENAIPPSASWHADYRDTAWIYIGGIPLDLSEGDVIIIFSQFGNPTHLNMIRDRETGKSKGFGFLKYEDQRSCDLAVDNLTGADVLGRMLRVDHTRYKKRDDEDEDTWRIDRLEAEASANANGKRASDTEEESEDERRRRKKQRPMLKEEKELERMLAIKENGEDGDPMKDYLIKEKRDEVRKARDRELDRERRHKHRHRHRDEDRKDRSEHKERRREDREEVDNVRRNRKDQRRGQESVDSDGDTVKRSSHRDRRREDEPRADSRNREGRSSRSKRSRRDSGTDSSSPERHKIREKEERPRRQRSNSREHRSSGRSYGAAVEDDGSKRSSGHRQRRQHEERDD